MSALMHASTSLPSSSASASLHFHCYLLRSMSPSHGRSTYIGFTTNPSRRLRQHNGQLVGGARRTASQGKRPWSLVCVVAGFGTAREALSFEWAWQHPGKSKNVKAALGEKKAKAIGNRHGAGARLELLQAMVRDCKPWAELEKPLQLFFLSAELMALGNSWIGCEVEVRELEDMPFFRDLKKQRRGKKRGGGGVTDLTGFRLDSAPEQGGGGGDDEDEDEDEEELRLLESAAREGGGMDEDDSLRHHSSSGDGDGDGNGGVGLLKSKLGDKRKCAAHTHDVIDLCGGDDGDDENFDDDEDFDDELQKNAAEEASRDFREYEWGGDWEEDWVEDGGGEGDGNGGDDSECDSDRDYESDGFSGDIECWVSEDADAHRTPQRTSRENEDGDITSSVATPNTSIARRFGELGISGAKEVIDLSMMSDD